MVPYKTFFASDRQLNSSTKVIHFRADHLTFMCLTYRMYTNLAEFYLLTLSAPYLFSRSMLLLETATTSELVTYMLKTRQVTL